MTVTYFRIPVELLGLGITSAPELMILALAAGFGEKGIRLSNNRLAAILHTERRTVVNALRRLRGKGYLVDESEGKQRRKLVASREIIALVDRGNSFPKLGKKSVSTRVTNYPTLIEEQKERKGYASPPPAGAPMMRDDPDEDEATQLLREVGVIV